MTLERIDHKEEAVKLLLSQYDASEDLVKLLKSWLTPIQHLEDTIIDFMETNGITTADGVMLDIIGEWFGIDREYRSDNEYRTAIIGRAVVERADGTTEKFLQAMRALCASNYVTFHEYYPNTIYAHAGEGWNNSLITELQRARAAGIHMRLVVDDEFDSFVPGEILSVDNKLVTNDGDNYVVTVDGVEYSVATSKNLGETAADVGDMLAELVDDEWVPPAELLTMAARVVEGFLVDHAGNNIVDHEGNKLTTRDLEY